jgi:nucleoside-diphosphate-sugar epimerase
VRSGRTVELASDGEGLWLTPTHVDDLAQIVAAAIEEGWSGTTNVATPEAVSLRRLAETVGGLLGRRPVFQVTDRAPLRLLPPVARLADRFDLARLRSLDDGLRDMIVQDHGAAAGR